MRHKLYLQIYLSFVGGLILFAFLAGGTWKLLSNTSEEHSFIDGLSTLVSSSLSEKKTKRQTQDTLKNLARAFHVELSLYNPQSTHIASSHEVVPLPKGNHGSNWDNQSPSKDVFLFVLNDGSQLAIHRHRRPFTRGLFFIGFILLFFALVAYPLSKRLTCRLEQLQKQVDEFGAGDLSARASIKGQDEIATLANHFNITAERIEKLIETQKHILAGASHELRTPLTRMRLAIELLNEGNFEQHKNKLHQYTIELDDLVEELLLASKLDAANVEVFLSPIDILALAAEEASLYEAVVTGDSATVLGNEHMLRRALKNLLDNASRYQKKQPIAVHVANQDATAVVRICDDGNGILEEDLPHVFEPFYQTRNTNHKQGSIGLGLSLVKKIVHQHHGKIICTNQASQGACFEIQLPTFKA